MPPAMNKEHSKLRESSKIYLDELAQNMIYPLSVVVQVFVHPFSDNSSIDLFIDLYDNGGVSTICTKRDWKF